MNLLWHIDPKMQDSSAAFLCQNILYDAFFSVYYLFFFHSSATMEELPVPPGFTRLTSLQSQHGRSLSSPISGQGESSSARGTEAAPTGHNADLNEAAIAQNNMPAQIHNLPRFVEVGNERSFTVEILEYGAIMPDQLWSTRHAIFPKGSWLTLLVLKLRHYQMCSIYFKNLSMIYNIPDSETCNHN
jgi:hypothetical protein